MELADQMEDIFNSLDELDWYRRWRNRKRKPRPVRPVIPKLPVRRPSRQQIRLSLARENFKRKFLAWLGQNWNYMRVIRPRRRAPEMSFPWYAYPKYKSWSQREFTEAFIKFLSKSWKYYNYVKPRRRS